MKKSFIWLVAAAVPVIVPLVVHASEGTATYDAELLSEATESVLEIANLVLGLLAAVFAVKLAALAQGGTLEKTWNLLAIAAGLFGLLEVNNALAGFGLVHVGGLEEIIELVFAALLLAAFMRTRKDLLRQVLGK